MDDTPIRAAQQLGAPPLVLDALRKRLQAQREAAVFGVWPEHWHAVEVFRAMRTQWQAVVGMEGLHYLGLNYTPLETVLKAVRPRIPRDLRRPLHELLPLLQVIEVVVTAARNART